MMHLLISIYWTSLENESEPLIQMGTLADLLCQSMYMITELAAGTESDLDYPYSRKSSGENL